MQKTLTKQQVDIFCFKSNAICSVLLGNTCTVINSLGTNEQKHFFKGTFGLQLLMKDLQNQNLSFYIEDKKKPTDIYSIKLYM